jgi:hypothetical protein
VLGINVNRTVVRTRIAVVRMKGNFEESASPGSS